MLTGRRAFDGDDPSITLANVLKEEVKWDALPANVPASIRRLLRRCLDKDARRCPDSIRVARLDIEDARAATDAGVASTGSRLQNWLPQPGSGR